MNKTQNQQKLLKILNEIFQLDQSDLDFGIYRIMNSKTKEINEFKDGDFVSLRRYKKDTYAIPYEGEEVKLHWANSDQYYIKSGECLCEKY